MDNKHKKFTIVLKCQKCGKEFSQCTTQHAIDTNRHRKCCSSQCAHSRVKTDAIKEKVKNTLNKFYALQGKSKEPKSLDECINRSLKRVKRLAEPVKVNCRFCNKEIYSKVEFGSYCYECAEQNNLQKIQLYNEFGKRLISKSASENLRNAQLKLIAEGKHRGWKTRNITSYPENFWKEVLKNNNTEYSFNHVVSKHDLGLDDKSKYFLDILLPGNIDLEIDGKQHKYSDRIKSDKIRDELLIKNGYKVYRIEWNEVSTEKGKLLMKEKIDNFLNYYNSINIK
jgi:hypothetical protein